MNNGKICVSVSAETADEMIGNITRAEEFADVIEVRFDCLEPSQVDKCRMEIARLNFKKPLLATFRSPEQGGNNTASIEDRTAFWQNPPLGFWAADVEEDVFGEAADWSNRILSHHDFEKTPDDRDAVYFRLAASDTEIIKIAVQADDIVDTIPVWKLLKRAKSQNQQIVPIAMGEAGKWTRILGLAYGAFMTYASLDYRGETAPGQITARDLVGIYRVRELDENTKVFGVIGDPVAQSLSPFMHNPAFSSRKINAVFVPFLVKDIGEFMRRLVRSETREVEVNFEGFSVTMPHKQSIMKHLDAIGPTAEKIGAVNTVKIEAGKLTGYNTDAHGFITPLKEKFGDLGGVRVALFGAGGAARACVYALKQENADVTVFARDLHQAELLATEFDVKPAELSLTKDQRSKIDLSSFEIVVDTTPLGMTGQFENESLFKAEQLYGVKFVYDLVTRPTDTPIIREAKKAGIPAFGGLEMLIAQGAKQFEIWTGQSAPVDEMKECVFARINSELFSTTV
ncbi:MAG: shikimate dehydrogenase [Pyrinomonadaceae bacterium]